MNFAKLKLPGCLLLAILFIVGIAIASVNAATVTVSSKTFPGAYPYGGSLAYVRIFSNATFVTSSPVTTIQQGSTSSFYQTVRCSVVGTNLVCPQFTINSTTDSNITDARYTADLYDWQNRYKQHWIEGFSVPASPSTTTWDALELLASGTTSFIPTFYYNTTQTDARLAAKQELLVCGTTIKTVNSTCILGSGNVTISGAAAWGGITGTLSSQTDLQSALSGKLSIASNLSDLVSASSARTNLGLGTSATHAAGDFLLAANNLSDVTAATARTNLGLGTAATHASTDFLLASNNLSDVTAATARTNLGLGTLATQSGTFSGTSSGTNTGDQTITLTGDVTGSGTGSFAATIGSSTISLAKMADVATGTVFYRKTAATGAPEVQTLATLKTDLGLSGTNTGDQTTISGNAGTATALAADPADCAANRFANAINASGTLTCGQVDLTTSAVTGILAAGNGGTGNAFFTVSGPATSIKTFTLPNASATVLTDNALVTAAQGGTGNGFFQVSGPATSTKTFTFPNASDTVAVLGTAQTFTANNIFGNTNLWAKDIGGSFKLNFKPGSTLTADRTLTFTTGDADRTVTLNGNTTLSGTNTGDQTITLTSDVTGSGTGSFATTIANSAVTLAKMADMATSSVFYRKTAGTGAPEVQTLATLKTDLGLTGTNSGDQTISLTGDVTGSGTGSFAATIGTNKVTSTTINANAVTLAKMDASNATANKMLLSGASASPTWSTSTIPTSAGATANKVLLSDGTNYVLSTPTFPNASATSGKYIKSDGTNWIASTGSASGTGTCTNQVATVLNSDAAPTCASITNAMLGAASYSQGTFVATCSGTATSSSTLFLFPIGQISAFTCTITTATSGIPMPAAGTIKNLRFVAGTGGKAGDAVTILKNASATGMPTCTYGTATTCSDTSTSGSVAAGDLITVKIVTTTTDTTANVQVSFQLWN